MKIKLIFIYAFISFLYTHTLSAEPSDFELELSRYNKKETHESIIESEGILYRKIEFKGNYYYLQLRNPDDSTEPQKVLCSPNHLKEENLARVYGEIKIVKRSSLFIEALKEACQSKPSAALKIGFTLPEKEKDTFKNKKIIIFPNFGVTGEF